MAVGNSKKMLDINVQYVLDFCHTWCKENNMSLGTLGEKLGHSKCYIQSSFRNKKLPPAELSLLCIITNMDYDKATFIEPDEEVKMDLTVDEKLDYIIEMLENLNRDHE